MSCEPIPRQDFWEGSDAWGHLLELGPQEQRVFSHLKHTVVPLGTPDHLIAGLLQELAPPALPAHGLPAGRLPLTRQPIRCGPRGNMSRITNTCTRTARSAFCGGWPKSHGGLASLLQQCSISLRTSSSSKGCKGCSTGALVRKTVIPRGPVSFPCL